MEEDAEQVALRELKEETLDETVWPTPKREAFLYSFNKEKYFELNRKDFD
jgi:hypothetical protein